MTEENWKEAYDVLHESLNSKEEELSVVAGF